MRIVIFGASGKTGSLLVQQALEAGHVVTAFIRRPETFVLEHKNLHTVVGNLNEKLKLRDAIKGADACISTLGGSSLTKHAPEIIEGIDNIISIMEQELVTRFIYLSSIGSGESRNLMSQPMRFFIADVMLRIPLADHKTNEQRITKSKLQWTVVRPGGLTDGLKTGNLKYGFENVKLKSSPSISRANVAAFMLQELSTTENVNKCVWLYE